MGQLFNDPSILYIQVRYEFYKKKSFLISGKNRTNPPLPNPHSNPTTWSSNERRAERTVLERQRSIWLGLGGPDHSNGKRPWITRLFEVSFFGLKN